MELDDVEVKKLCRKVIRYADGDHTKCRAIGMEKFSSAEECRTHLEQEHAADFKPHSAKDMVKRIGKTWAYKILVGVWEPVDAVAAVGMIKTQLAYVKAFTSKSRKKGWSNEWPLAAVEERNSVSGNLESALGEGAARYNSALDMTALMNINVLKEDIKYNKQPFHGNLEEQVPYELQNLFSAVVSGEIKTEGVYSFILRDLLASLEEAKSMSSGAAEVLVTILESWHRWTNLERESLVTRLFTLEENERMHCRKCRRMPNYPEQSSYGIVMAADSIRDLKCTFRNMKFVDILKVMRMEYKMLCDIKSGGCGTTNFVHHVISRCPSIFIIVLEWEKSETEKEIFETTKALEWEIDISRLYKGLEQNTNYRLVSMVGYGEEEREHICMAYEKSRWVNLRRESLAGEVVGNNWKNVVRFCGERKVRPEILFYEELPDP
uniref:DUF629 domain-containing protein n=1 Tax=Brassica campestris TaxID=3711 RepID=M4EKI6_BRACM